MFLLESIILGLALLCQMALSNTIQPLVEFIITQFFALRKKCFCLTACADLQLCVKSGLKAKTNLYVANLLKFKESLLEDMDFIEKMTEELLEKKDPINMNLLHCWTCTGVLPNYFTDKFHMYIECSSPKYVPIN